MKRIALVLFTSLLVCVGVLSPAHAGLTVAQNSTTTVKIGPFVDTAGALVTGLTINAADVRLSANGGGGAAKNTGGCTHDTNMQGYYTCTFNTVDLATVGLLQVSVAVSGALPVYHEFQVLPGATYGITYASTATGFPTASSSPQLGILRQGTAQSATSTTLVMDTGATFADDTAIGMTVLACGSTQGYCQSRPVTDNVLSTDTLTVPTWTVTPSGTITYYLVGTAPASGGGGGSTAAEIWAYADRQLTAFDEDATAIDINATPVGSVVGSVASVTGAVGSVTGSVGSVAGNVTGNVVGSVGSVATNGITANSLAADAGTELGTAAWATTTRVLTAGTNIALAKGTGVTGFNDPTVGAIADQVWDELLSGHLGAGSAGAALSAASTGGIDASQIRAALGMASANMDTQLSTINTNVVDLDGNMTWNPAWDGEVQSEVADALNALAITEPTGKPAWGGTPWEWMAWIGAWTRNEIQQTSSQKILRNDANNANIATCAVTDNTTTLTVAECAP